MTELTNNSIIVNNLPASQLDLMVEGYDEDLYLLADKLSSAGNKLRYTFAAVLSRIEREDGKDAREKYLFQKFGEKRSFIYKWTNAYKEIKEYSDEAKEFYFNSGEEFGVTLGQYFYTMSNMLEKAGLKRLTSEQFIEAGEHIKEEGLNVSDAKDYIKQTYLPKQDDNNLGTSPSEVPDFNNKIEFDEKPVLQAVKFKKDDLDIVCQWFDVGNLPEDPMERGDVIYRAIQTKMLIKQASGG